MHERFYTCVLTHVAENIGKLYTRTRKKGRWPGNFCALLYFPFSMILSQIDNLVWDSIYIRWKFPTKFIYIYPLFTFLLLNSILSSYSSFIYSFKDFPILFAFIFNDKKLSFSLPIIFCKNTSDSLMYFIFISCFFAFYLIRFNYINSRSFSMKSSLVVCT